MSLLRMLKAKELIRALQKAGFEQVLQRGSHARFKHPDGRVVSVPIHAGQDIGRGLLIKILRDAEISIEEVLDLIE